VAASQFGDGPLWQGFGNLQERRKKTDYAKYGNLLRRRPAACMQEDGDLEISSSTHRTIFSNILEHEKEPR